MASQLDGLQPQPSQEKLIGIFSVYEAPSFCYKFLQFQPYSKQSINNPAP